MLQAQYLYSIHDIRLFSQASKKLPNPTLLDAIILFIWGMQTPQDRILLIHSRAVFHSPCLPDKVYTQLKSDLESSEKDGFEYVTGGSPNPADDLRPYNISSPKKFQFILQDGFSILSSTLFCFFFFQND